MWIRISLMRIRILWIRISLMQIRLWIRIRIHITVAGPFHFDKDPDPYSLDPFHEITDPDPSPNPTQNRENTDFCLTFFNKKIYFSRK